MKNHCFPIIMSLYDLFLFNTDKSYLLNFPIGATNNGNFFSFSSEAF